MSDTPETDALEQKQSSEGCPQWNDMMRWVREHAALACKLERERDEAREALEHIVEYWNRDENETSMSDALWHIIQTAVDVLHATKLDQLKEGGK
jgi:hypothetical protein